jgi:hypothetical protein
MFTKECSYRPTTSGFVFLPADLDTDLTCDLVVSFEPVAYYPAEPRIGAGDDFDARIVSIEMIDACDLDISPRVMLAGDSYRQALSFLEATCSSDMWEQAAEETVAALGVRRAA